jgi:NADPH:quinone reductase-like Zn-dependent oxidoreductase
MHAVPRGEGTDEAGGVPVSVLTMHDALITNGKVAPGESVLVHAGTST